VKERPEHDFPAASLPSKQAAKCSVESAYLAHDSVVNAPEPMDWNDDIASWAFMKTLADGGAGEPFWLDIYIERAIANRGEHGEPLGELRHLCQTGVVDPFHLG
jgi:hypothetical protein